MKKILLLAAVASAVGVAGFVFAQRQHNLQITHYRIWNHTDFGGYAGAPSMPQPIIVKEVESGTEHVVDLGDTLTTIPTGIKIQILSGVGMHCCSGNPCFTTGCVWFAGLKPIQNYYWGDVQTRCPSGGCGG